MDEFNTFLIQNTSQAVTDLDDTVMFNIINRTIMPNAIEDIVVKDDNDSRTIKYKIQRLFENVDLSTKSISFRYTTPDQQSDESFGRNITVSSDTIIFEWKIDGSVTHESGLVEYDIMFYDANGYKWHTKPATLKVEVGLKQTTVIPQPSTEWIDSWREEAGQILTDCRNIYNTVTDTVKKYSVSFSGSSPMGTRLDSAIGMIANVAVNNAIVQNDFDSVSFFNRPICCCTWDENKRKWRVNAYKGEPDFKSDGSNGEVMYECTPFYYKADFSSSGSPIYVSVTGTPCEGYTLAPIFKNAVDKVYCPSYWLSEVSGTATSRSGTYPLYGSLNELMTKAKTFDEKAYLETMQNVFSDYMLMLVEFATKDLQTVMMGCTNLRYNQEDIIQSVTADGFSITSSIASNYVVGQTISIGTTKNAEDKTSNVKITNIETSGDVANITLSEKIENLAVGDYISSRWYINGATDVVEASSGSPVSNTDGKHPCIWRGKVDPWGNGFSLISNMLIKKEGDNYIPYYLEDPYKYNSGSITEDYIKSNMTVLSTNGYVKSFKSDSRYPFLITPSELGATYNTYASANFYAPRYAVNSVRVGGGFISRRESSPVHFGCSSNPTEKMLFYLGRLNISD